MWYNRGEVMEMARFKISEEEYKELYRIEKATKDKKISQRLRVVMMRYEGKKVREIAEALDLNQQSISRICARYRKEGVEEFARNKYTSHHRYLSKEEESEILERFLKEANAGKVVSIEEIRKAFDEVIGHKTPNSFIYKVLKRHKWRKVMPRPRHPKAADEEACEASKKLSKK